MTAQNKRRLAIIYRKKQADSLEQLHTAQTKIDLATQKLSAARAEIKKQQNRIKGNHISGVYSAADLTATMLWQRQQKENLQKLIEQQQIFKQQLSTATKDHDAAAQAIAKATKALKQLGASRDCD